MDLTDNQIADFWDAHNKTTKHYGTQSADKHPFSNELNNFLNTYDLHEKKCLEIGSGGGSFQNIVNDYIGTDVSPALSSYYHKPFLVSQGAHIPLDNESVDVIWTINVHEHIQDIQTALLEIRRILRQGGYLFFAPAWHTRPWFAGNYRLKSFKELTPRGKLIKASIPIRNSILWRALYIFPKRFVRHLFFLLGYRYASMRYRRLKANYIDPLDDDSDACNSLDPHDAILYFCSNGFECLSHSTHFKIFFVHSLSLSFRKINTTM